jgi:hypothetical protein
VYLFGCALLLATFSLSCASARPSAVTTSRVADALAAHGLNACGESPFAGRVGSPSDPTTSTSASLLADTHPDLFAGVWWDGANGQYVFDTVGVAAATMMLNAGLAVGTSYRVDHVGRSLTELRVLQDRAMSIDVAGAFMSASPRSWDGTVNVSIPALGESSLGSIAAEFSDDLDAICVGVGGAVAA